MGKISKQNISFNKGRHLKDLKEDSYPKIDHPVFCFRYTHRKYCVEVLPIEERAELITRIEQISKLTWTEIQLTQKHGFGSEKIKRGSIKPDIPSFVTPDVNHLIAIRYSGFKPIVGFRNKFIFHLLFIDHDYSVYDHG